MNPFAPFKESRETQIANFVSYLWKKFVNAPEKVTKIESAFVKQYVKRHGFDKIKSARE